MTKLPLETWAIIPRPDLPSYEMNQACPVTGDVGDLEDHHIWRRSFTAQGREMNENLYWVEAGGKLYKNRIALSPEAHQRITVNRAYLEYDEETGALWYVEGGARLNLDVKLRLMSAGETVTKKRRKSSTKEERKARVNYTIRAPKDEENLLPELEEALREKLAQQLGWTESVPAYFVWSAAAAQVLQS